MASFTIELKNATKFDISMIEEDKKKIISDVKKLWTKLKRLNDDGKDLGCYDIKIILIYNEHKKEFTFDSMNSELSESTEKRIKRFPELLKAISVKITNDFFLLVADYFKGCSFQTHSHEQQETKAEAITLHGQSLRKSKNGKLIITKKKQVILKEFYN